MMEVTQAGGTQAEPATQPQAGNPPTTTPANPPAGADPTGTTQAASEQMSLDEAKKLRQEHNTLRKRIAEYEAAQKVADEAKLSAEEKLQRQYAQKEREHADAQAELQDYRLRFAALDTGADLGLTTPKAVDAALKLMDRAALEFDESGKPTNLAKVLKAAIAEYPFLTANGGTQQRPPANSGGATNPGAGQSAATSASDVTWQQYIAMSQAERVHPPTWAKITGTLARNNGRFPGQP